MAVEVKAQSESKAYRMRVEAALTPLWRRQAELEKRLSSLEHRPPSGVTPLDVAVSTRQRVREISAQIADQLVLLEGIEEEKQRVVAPSRPADTEMPGHRTRRGDAASPTPAAPRSVASSGRPLDPLGSVGRGGAEDQVPTERLRAANDELCADIARVRHEVHGVLSGLATSLHRYEELVAHKSELSRRLTALTGKDQAYANYIDCALIRQAEFEGDLRYVVDLLKRLHVAS